jgi:hypothetical protein
VRQPGCGGGAAGSRTVRRLSCWALCRRWLRPSSVTSLRSRRGGKRRVAGVDGGCHGDRPRSGLRDEWPSRDFRARWHVASSSAQRSQRRGDRESTWNARCGGALQDRWAVRQTGQAWQRWAWRRRSTSGRPTLRYVGSTLLAYHIVGKPWESYQVLSADAGDTAASYFEPALAVGSGRHIADGPAGLGGSAAPVRADAAATITPL